MFTRKLNFLILRQQKLSTLKIEAAMNLYFTNIFTFVLNSHLRQCFEKSNLKQNIRPKNVSQSKQSKMPHQNHCMHEIFMLHGSRRPLLHTSSPQAVKLMPLSDHMAKMAGTSTQTLISFYVWCGVHA